VPPFKFAMIDGEIELAVPGTSTAFQQAMMALCGISHRSCPSAQGESHRLYLMALEDCGGWKTASSILPTRTLALDSHDDAA
jgi:hypothetical protein